VDLSHALEAHADRVAERAVDDLTSDTAKAEVRARVARGQRIHARNLATGIAAGVAIMIALGAWEAPRFLADPTQATPIASASATPRTPEYVATPFHDLPEPGTPEYFAQPVGYYVGTGPVVCSAVPTLPMLPTSPPFRYVHMVPTWIYVGRLTYGFEDVTWIPLYAPQDDWYDVAVEAIGDPDVHETLILVDANGGWWGYDLMVAHRDDSQLGGTGVYAHLYPADGDCGGGDRTFGGPIPSGLYEAREVLYRRSDDSTLVRDLGTIEITPGPVSSP